MSSASIKNVKDGSSITNKQKRRRVLVPLNDPYPSSSSIDLHKQKRRRVLVPLKNPCSSEPLESNYSEIANLVNSLACMQSKLMTVPYEYGSCQRIPSLPKNLGGSIPYQVKYGRNHTLEILDNQLLKNRTASTHENKLTSQHQEQEIQSKRMLKGNILNRALKKYEKSTLIEQFRVTLNIKNHHQLDQSLIINLMEEFVS